MHLSHRLLVLSAVFAVGVPVARAQAADPSGHWEGSIQSPRGTIGIEIDLAKNESGAFIGTMTTPAQGLRGLPLSNFVASGRDIAFQVAGTPGERAFSATLADDGKTLSGDYAQLGYNMPFQLTRAGEARIDPPTRNAAIARELEGTWNATLDDNGSQRDLVLTLSNRADGTSVGSILNVDEGLEIPIATITQQGSSLTLGVTAVGASFSGALSADRTQVVGTLTHGSASLPVTFRRAVATKE